MKLDSYRELKVWQMGMKIAAEVYILTRDFPKSELYGMTSQIRRAASSIPANIAEGYGRQYRKEYIQFLRIANGSLKELETHLLLSEIVDLTTDNLIQPLLQRCDDLGRMLLGQIHSLESKEDNRVAESGADYEFRLLDSEDCTSR